nr:acetyltransferase [uncultured Shinella sp.]
MLQIRTSKPADITRTYEIWRTSVEATHHFLSPLHFLQIDDLVRNSYLPSVELLLAVNDQDIAHGFMGSTNDQIDALFVHADSRGKGIGRFLVDHMRKSRSEVTVDVNEQNVSGCGFYRRLGFLPVGRSETDVQNLPYPLLHLRWTHKQAVPPQA